MTALPLDLTSAAPLPAANPSALNAVEMTAMLRRHYQPEGRPPCGIFAPEIQSPDGKRRADLIWMPTTIAGGRGELHGHEIKCSRADLVNELADPTKADPWAQYCSRWWLVVSRPDLVAGLTIPDAWGILAPPSGRRTRTMTILRPAPKLDPGDATAGFARIAAWQLYAGHDRAAQLEHSARREADEAKRLRERVRELEAAGGQRPSGHAKRVDRILDLVEEMRQNRHVWFADAADEDIASALVDLTAARAAAEQLRGEVLDLARTAERFLEPARRTHEALAKIGARLPRRGDTDSALTALRAAFPQAEVVA